MLSVPFLSRIVTRKLCRLPSSLPASITRNFSSSLKNRCFISLDVSKPLVSKPITRLNPILLNWRHLSLKSNPTHGKDGSWNRTYHSEPKINKDSKDPSEDSPEGPEERFTALQWFGIVAAVAAALSSPWTLPLLKKTQKVVTEEDILDFERSKANSDIKIDYHRALHEAVFVEAKPKTWLQRRLFDVKVFLRMIQLSLLFSPAAFLAPIAYWIPFLRPLWWWCLHLTVDQAGGCWIKLGQWATTRPDIFPSSMLELFDSFTSQCTPHSFEDTRRIIRESYNVELEELFDEFGQTPIAAGAIAQIHKAKLKLSGDTVAVKVLHPGIANKIQVDLSIMHLGARILSLIPDSEWLALTETVEQFASTMIAQVDMRYEARNLMRFGQNFEGDSAIIFPRVIDHMSTKEVLVETFEIGQPLTTYLKHSDNVEERKKLAHIGLRAYLTMLLVHNFIHADMHPGNLLVRKDPHNQNIQLVLLDVGLICELSSLDWLHFKQLFKCIVQGDGKAGARLMVEHARQKKISEKEKEAFTTEMDALFSEIRNSKLSEIQIGLFLSNMFSVVRNYKVKIDTNFTTLCVGTVLLEGIGRQLDSEINILDQSVPFLVWSEKANLEDRIIFLREKMKDEFLREDSKELPLYQKFYNIIKPLLVSLESI